MVRLSALTNSLETIGESLLGLGHLLGLLLSTIPPVELLETVNIVASRKTTRLTYKLLLQVRESLRDLGANGGQNGLGLFHSLTLKRLI